MTKHTSKKLFFAVGQRLLYLALAVGLAIVGIQLFMRVGLAWIQEPSLGYQIAGAICILATPVTIVLAGIFLYSAIVGSFKEATDRIEEWARKVKLGRRLRYLLGSAACFGVVYLLWLVTNTLNQTARLVRAVPIFLGLRILAAMGSVVSIFFALAGLLLVMLTIIGRSLDEFGQ